MILKIPSLATDQDFPGFLAETFRRIAERQIRTLVIDLRDNQGGRDEYGALLYAYLAMSPSGTTGVFQLPLRILPC